MKYLNLRTSFLAILFVMAADIIAQTSRIFVVEEVGEKPVILHNGKKHRNIVPRDLLTLDNMITIPKGGKLVVLDHIRQSRRTIINDKKTNLYANLAELLDGSKKKSFVKMTFAGLIARLFSNEPIILDNNLVIDRKGKEKTDSIIYSLDGHETGILIYVVLNDSTVKIPEVYATFLNTVLQDIERSEVKTDSISE